MTYNLEDLCWRFTDNREWAKHLNKWPPVIISCAITGGMHSKAATPNLPQSPEEQADATYEAYKAGASIVHIHARSPASNYYEGQSATAKDFLKVNQLVRERCPDIIINNTGSNMFGPDFDEAAMIRFLEICNPEICSLDVGMLYIRNKVQMTPELVEQTGGAEGIRNMGKSMNAIMELLPDGRMLAEVCTPLGYSKTEWLAGAMKATNVKPEIEIFGSQGWWFVDNLIEKQLLEPPYWCQLVFGQDGASNPPSIKSAIEVLNDLPDLSLFSTIGIGPMQLPMTTLGLILGGHIRVGLEDNIYYRRGELAESNAQQVERAVRIAHELNREVATPKQARQMLGLGANPKQY